MKKIHLISILLGFVLLTNAEPTILKNFGKPSEEAKPWTFWYWMHGAVSKEGIKADLTAMHEIGLGGAYLMSIRGVEDSKYTNPVNQLSPEWWEMVRYSFQVADSLGLKMGMHISDGFALAGGPWITAAESMQKVVFTDTIIKGGGIKNLKLKQPETLLNYYQDIVIYALPVNDVPFNNRFSLKSDQPDDLVPFSIAGKDFRSEQPCNIDYTFEKPFTLRSIEISPAGNNFQSQRLQILSGNDGKKYLPVKQLVPPRQGWQNSGFNTTFSVPPTTARFFRLNWNPEGTEPGSEETDAAKWKPTLKIKNIKLSPTARINGWEGKSGLVWRIADKTDIHEISDAECTPLNQLIDLTAHFINGKLTCKLPKGNWRILRIGHTSTGLTNATGGGGKGLECDKFSKAAVQKQFDNWFGAAFTKTDSITAHRVLKFMHIDSWECGSQNWSDNFLSEFHSRRGYDLKPFMPLFAGFPVENIEKSELVLHDIRTTIAELVNDVFFSVMDRNAKAMGCETSAESIAPTFTSDGMNHFKIVDRPMGEFWLNSPTHDKPNDMLDAISGAHVYGKKIVQAEGFTQLRTNWNEDPAMLKPLLDRNFALGLNKLFFHVFVHNPYTDKAPGLTLDGIGLYFQRDQTWWKQGKAFVDYISRCQTLLQYGNPVVDFAVFNGEEIPHRSLTPDKVVKLLPQLAGKKRMDSEYNRLSNKEQPMVESPAGVFHSANILKAEDWINPLNGYAYDSFNKEVLLASMPENGKLITANRMSYNALVLPSTTELPYSNNVIQKIKEIEKAGVPLIDKSKNTNIIEPDIIVSENIAWTHRTGTEGDVYFISNQENIERNPVISLRRRRKEISLWNPVTATVESIDQLTDKENRTQIKLKLAPYQSVFIVLSDSDFESCKSLDSKPVSTNLNTKWNIEFLKNGQKVGTTELFDWSKNDNPLIRFYSGTALYNGSFTWSITDKRAILNLGKVCNIAGVSINGIDCGTAWTAPYEVDITKALRKGINSIEIKVTNTWANAINGMDKGTPPFEGIWTDGKYRMKENKLIEAGLLGPLTIIQ